MRLFLTGGTGFIGREVMSRLLDDGIDEIRCLTRDAAGLPSHARLEPVLADLGDDATSLDDAVRGCDAVLHLAALTGRAAAADLRRVNVEGTARLLDAARRAGVPRFVHVSTIAVSYPEKKYYPYARSKDEAERLVRESGLDWAILRPTVVCGTGSPVATLLATLARLPVLPLFDGGRSLVQPVHVTDVADALVALARQPSPGGRTIDFGGRDVVRFAELLGRLRRELTGREGPRLPVPLTPIVPLLGLVEPVLLPVLPVTAGQFYAFRHDGVARDDPQTEPPRAARRGVDEIVGEILGVTAGGEGTPDDGGTPDAGPMDEDRLDTECRVFARYLAGIDADDALRAHYRRAHEPGRHGPVDAGSRRDDDPLVAFARRGTHATRLADTWAALFDRGGSLRRKLALLLAMLESRAATTGRVDGPTASSPVEFALGAALRVAAFLLALPIAAVVTLPRRARRSR